MRSAAAPLLFGGNLHGSERGTNTKFQNTDSVTSRGVGPTFPMRASRPRNIFWYARSARLVKLLLQHHDSPQMMLSSRTHSTQEKATRRGVWEQKEKSRDDERRKEEQKVWVSAGKKHDGPQILLIFCAVIVVMHW